MSSKGPATLGDYMQIRQPAVLPVTSPAVVTAVRPDIRPNPFVGLLDHRTPTFQIRHQETLKASTATPTLNEDETAAQKQGGKTKKGFCRFSTTEAREAETNAILRREIENIRVGLEELEVPEDLAMEPEHGHQSCWQNNNSCETCIARFEYMYGNIS